MILRSKLLSTTAVAGTALAGIALFAAPAQAEPIEVSVGGFMNQWFGYQDNDISDVQDFDQWSDSEIIFDGKVMLDVGIEVGMQVQLEANSSGDQIDESYAYLEAEFGRFVAGSTDDAAYLMHYAAPNVALPINSGSQTQYIIEPTGSPLFQTVYGSTFITPALDDTGQKITYYTPRFSGFQFGVSYLPDVDPTGGDRNSLTLDTTDYHNGFSAGLNYVHSYEMGLDVAASVGYSYAEAPDGLADPVSGGQADDFQGFMAGLNLGYEGFTLGGSYAKITDGVIIGTTTTEGQAYDVGLSYETGDIGVSVTYFHGETDGDFFVAGESEHDSYALSGAYALGPGVSILGTVGYTEFDGEIAGSGDDNDGFYVTTGLALSF
jgi:outer membrane protein OmpU